MSLNKVDLPAPLGPIIPTMAPLGTVKLKLSINRRPSKPLDSLSKSKIESPKRNPGGI